MDVKFGKNAWLEVDWLLGAVADAAVVVVAAVVLLLVVAAAVGFVVAAVDIFFLSPLKSMSLTSTYAGFGF